MSAGGIEPFGYMISWLAIEGEPAEVIEALGLTDTQEKSWSEGLRIVSIPAGPQPQIRVFVTPQISGWTLVVGWALPQLDAGLSDKFVRLMDVLRNRFDRVCFFATHRVVELQAWAITDRQGIVRAFAYIGESGEVLANEGAVGPEEVALGMPAIGGIDPQAATDLLFAQLEDGGDLPDESWVIELARQWSLDPTTLDTLGLPPSSVVLGSLPRALWAAN